jgi:hypothetical protein
MIWTVILKNGSSFVVYGDSYERNREVEKCLKVQHLRKTSIAAIVQGDHDVEAFDALKPSDSRRLRR